MRREFRAPGRVNLIGDHTDYNDGFVMPLAIQLDTRVAITPTPDPQLRLTSDGMPGPATIPLDRPFAPRRDWTDYVVGVANVLRQHGVAIAGAELSISSTVPKGAGLSSSAALEVAAAFALLGDREVDRLTVARWCQQAENEFVGAPCGIMDQYVSCLGRRGHALLIDCRSLVSRAIALPAKARIVVCNSMVKHSVASGEYRVRREQCNEAVRVLQQMLPQIGALRDVTTTDLARYADRLSPLLHRRASHVVSENARVLHAADALERNDLSVVGHLMNDSHRSLRDDFEVSVPSLDLLVDLANRLPGVYGSRMTGGGFGGSTVTLVDETACESFVENIRTEFHHDVGTWPDVIVCTPADGAGEVAA